MIFYARGRACLFLYPVFFCICRYLVNVWYFSVRPDCAYGSCFIFRNRSRPGVSTYDSHCLQQFARFWFEKIRGEFVVYLTYFLSEYMYVCVVYLYICAFLTFVGMTGLNNRLLTDCWLGIGTYIHIYTLYVCTLRSPCKSSPTYAHT